MRIISGSARGRKLKTLPGMSTRPTTDKVKGAIFNVLANKISEAKVLDLFAGSGALGLEALSRGASYVVMVEKSISAYRVIMDNVNLTGYIAQTRLVNRDGITYLKDLQGEQFDLVFLDPPYRQGLALKSLQILSSGNYLSLNAVIIVETSRDEELPVEIGILGLRKSAEYGDTVIWYYQPTETEGKEN